MNDLSEADKVRAAYKVAKANVNQEFPPHIIAACSRESDARMERLATGQTTVKDEEAKLLSIWKKLQG